MPPDERKDNDILEEPNLYELIEKLMIEKARLQEEIKELRKLFKKDHKETIKELVHSLKYDNNFTDRVSNEVKKSVFRNNFVHQLADKTLEKMRPTIKFLSQEECKHYFENTKFEKRLNNCEREFESLKKGFKELIRNHKIKS